MKRTQFTTSASSLHLCSVKNSALIFGAFYGTSNWFPDLGDECLGKLPSSGLCNPFLINLTDGRNNCLCVSVNVKKLVKVKLGCGRSS